jgi:hypothetical protein
MRAIVALAAASCLWLAGPAARAQPLEDENLLLAPPAGFEVGHHQDSRDGVTLIEWVPAGETVQNWSEMVTVLVFRKRPDLDPEGFLRRLQAKWLTDCKGAAPAPVMKGNVNGYVSATMLMRCPLFPSTGKPETTIFGAIKGKDALYMVQRAVRAAGSPAEVERLRAYMAEVSACDTRSREHPCPDLKPAGR